MMKASVNAKYDPKKAATTGGAAIAFNASEIKLRASMIDAAVTNGRLSLNGLAFAVEKPDSFIFDYKVSEKDFKFQFMNSIMVLEKPLNLKYTHSVRVLKKPLNLNDIDSKGDSRTILDGTLVLDSANKVSANHVLGSGGCKLKYSYVHGGITTFEPSYDTTENSWDFAVSHKVYGDNVCRATYQTKSNDLGLEWSRSSKLNGSFKVSASLCLDDMALKLPKLTAESSWDFDI